MRRGTSQGRGLVGRGREYRSADRARGGPARARPRSCRELALSRLTDARELLFQGSELALYVAPVVLTGGEGDAVLREECGHEGVGVARDRHGDALVEHPVEPKDDREALPRAHRGECGREIPDQELAEVLQLFHDLAG